MTTRRAAIGALVGSVLVAQRAGAQATPEASPIAIDPEQADELMGLLTPTPAATEESGLSKDLELTTLPGYIDADVRMFESADAGFELFLGGLIALIAVAVEFETEANASQGLDRLVDRGLALFQGNMATNEKFETDEEFEVVGTSTQEVSIGRLGDERLGTILTVEINNEFIDELVVVAAAIRQERWVQLLMGFGVSGVTTVLVDIAEDLIDRWPSDDLENMLPNLDDMPPGMAIVME